MSASRQGKEAEKRVRADLELNGYTINQSHLSRGAADFIAGKPGERLACQVKRSRRSGGGIGPEPWNALIDVAEAFDAIPVVAFAPPRRPVEYLRLLGRKDGKGGAQPWEPMIVDFATEGSPHCWSCGDRPGGCRRCADELRGVV